MAELGKYVYCIIACQRDRTFDVAAIGSEYGAVHTVSHEGLAAVVSDSSVKQYESTRKNLVAHEKVQEVVMKEYTLLPVRFGTAADSTNPIQEIQRLLGSRFEEFHKLLADMEGKVELGLKAFWRDEQAVFAEIVAENAEIKHVRDSLSGKPPEATHFDRIRLGEMVQKALSRKRATEAAKIMLPLRPVAHSLRESAVLLDRMVVNAAFLVDRVREPEFDKVVSKLDEQLGERIAFKYIGPVPPYNFVNIVVNWQERG